VTLPTVVSAASGSALPVRNVVRRNPYRHVVDDGGLVVVNEGTAPLVAEHATREGAGARKRRQ